MFVSRWASLLKTRFVFNCMKGLSSFFKTKYVNVYYEFAFKFIKSIKEHVCWNSRIHVLSLGVSKVGGHLCPPPPHSGTWMHVCSHVHARRHPIEAENMLHTMYTHGTSAHRVCVCVCWCLIGAWSRGWSLMLRERAVQTRNTLRKRACQINCDKVLFDLHVRGVCFFCWLQNLLILDKWFFVLQFNIILNQIGLGKIVPLCQSVPVYADTVPGLDQF